MELKPGDSAAEKELSQLLQAQSALETTHSLYDLGNFSKSLEYIDKVVLVFSSACNKVTLVCSYSFINIFYVLCLSNYTI